MPEFLRELHSFGNLNKQIARLETVYEKLKSGHWEQIAHIDLYHGITLRADTVSTVFPATLALLEGLSKSTTPHKSAIDITDLVSGMLQLAFNPVEDPPLKPHSQVLFSAIQTKVKQNSAFVFSDIFSLIEKLTNGTHDQLNFINFIANKFALLGQSQLAYILDYHLYNERLNQFNLRCYSCGSATTYDLDNTVNRKQTQEPHATAFQMPEILTQYQRDSVDSWHSIISDHFTIERGLYEAIFFSWHKVADTVNDCEDSRVNSEKRLNYFLFPLILLLENDPNRWGLVEYCRVAAFLVSLFSSSCPEDRQKGHSKIVSIIQSIPETAFECSHCVSLIDFVNYWQRSWKEIPGS